MKNNVYILVAAALLLAGSGMIESAGRGGTKSERAFTEYKRTSDNFKKALAAHDFTQAANILSSAKAEVKNLYKREFNSLHQRLKDAQAKFATEAGTAPAAARGAGAPRITAPQLRSMRGVVPGVERKRAAATAEERPLRGAPQALTLEQSLEEITGLSNLDLNSLFPPAARNMYRKVLQGNVNDWNRLKLLLQQGAYEEGSAEEQELIKDIHDIESELREVLSSRQPPVGESKRSAAFGEESKAATGFEAAGREEEERPAAAAGAGTPPPLPSVEEGEEEDDDDDAEFF